MSYTIELSKGLTDQDLESAAQLTAAGFGRPADQHNYIDTKNHVLSIEHLQLLRSGGELVGFAAYRGLLWQSSY